MKETYITITDKGVLEKERFKSFLRDLGLGKWFIKAEKKDKRSNQQNKYLHAVMLPIVRDALREAGWNNIKTIEDAKDFIKIKFLKYDLVNENTGEVVEMYRNTSALTKMQFSELVQDVQIWLDEYFSIDLPLPGQQTMFNY